MAGQVNKRKDKDRIVLRKGESQRKDGNYDYRWTTRDGKRHSVYAKTLEELRAKEEEILRDKCDGIKTEARYVTINCKCQYKNVGFLENKSVGFPTSLFSIFLVIFRHILHLIL